MWHKRESHIWGVVSFSFKNILKVCLVTSGVLSTEDAEIKYTIDKDMAI